MEFKLRDYQREAVDAGVDYFLGKSRTNALIVASTGAGKSLIISKIAQEINSPVLVLQPSRELVLQNHGKAVSFGMAPTIYSASCEMKELSSCTYATIKSIRNIAKEFKDLGVKYVIVDEADMGIPAPRSNEELEKGSVFSRFIEELEAKKILGVTASPVKMQTYSPMAAQSYSQLNMLTRLQNKTFSKIIHVTQNAEMVRRGFWSELEYERWNFDGSTLLINSTGSEYTEESVKCAVQSNNINNLIYKRMMELIKERKHILIFMDSVNNCNILHEFLEKETQVKSVVVSAGMTNKARIDAVEGFKSGKYQVALNYGALGVGFDFPDLDCIIMGRPTFSLRVWYQLCLDMDTEILTKRGWMKYKDISKNDKTASYVDGKIVWSTIENIVHRNLYPGERMVEFNNMHVNFRVTEDHDLLTSWNHKKYIKQTAISAMEREDGFFVPVSGCEDIPDYKGLNDCDIKLLGYIMSDGYISKNGRTCIITQSEKNMKNINDIEDTLKKCGIKYGITKQRKIVKFEGYEEKDYGIMYMFRFNKGEPKNNIDNLHGFKYMEEFMDKSFPDIYEKLSKRQISIFLESLNAGDGNKKINVDYIKRTYEISMGDNYTFANKLQSLLVRRGYRCKMHTNNNTKNKKTSYILYIKDIGYSFISGKNTNDSIKNGKHTHRPKIKISESYENEEVWCVKNNIGNIVTRRSGKVVIMGNCGRAVRVGNKKNALIVDCCGNYDRFGPIENLSVEDYAGYGWGMFSEDRLLTGIPMGMVKTKQQLVREYGETPAARWVRDKGYDKPPVQKYKTVEHTYDPGDVIMDSGIFRGKRMRDIPISYLEFRVNSLPEDKVNRHMLEYYKSLKQ